MPTHTPSPSNGPTQPPRGAGSDLFPVIRLPPELYQSAASRLVSAEAGEASAAGKRFVQAAPTHGIDLSLMWGTVGVSPIHDKYIRQVCLAVLGAGRTAVLFLSGPRAPRAGLADRAAENAELVRVIQASCTWLAREKHGLVKVVQSLPEPGEAWAISALEAAGLRRVGDLAYLRCPLARRRGVPAPSPSWPIGVTVRAVTSMAPGSADRNLLAAALDRSYEATLDCPGLCGMRETQDVIDSHVSTGRFDPALWWLVFLDGEPHGCALFNPCPEQNTVELVYLGLSPQLRGRGVASQLLAHGLSRIGGPGRLSVTCAVDRRNTPAISLYGKAGFSEFSGRAALVRALP